MIRYQNVEALREMYINNFEKLIKASENRQSEDDRDEEMRLYGVVDGILMCAKNLFGLRAVEYVAKGGVNLEDENLK